MTAGVPPLAGFPGLRDLPEDVRAGLEEHQDELRNEEDYRRLVNELMLRRWAEKQVGERPRLFFLLGKFRQFSKNFW